jgi:hypothetical protein
MQEARKMAKSNNANISNQAPFAVVEAYKNIRIRLLYILENMHGKGAYRVRKGGSYNDVNCRSSAHGIPYYSQNANSASIGYRLCAPVKLMD